jgi:hypothetical protein
MPSNGWVVSGTDQNGDVWVVRADNEDTADHIAQMFRDAGYTDVSVEELP